MTITLFDNFNSISTPTLIHKPNTYVYTQTRVFLFLSMFSFCFFYCFYESTFFLLLILSVTFFFPIFFNEMKLVFHFHFFCVCMILVRITIFIDLDFLIFKYLLIRSHYCHKELMVSASKRHCSLIRSSLGGVFDPNQRREKKKVID